MEGEELPGSCLCSELGCYMSIKPLFGGGGSPGRIVAF